MNHYPFEYINNPEKLDKKSTRILDTLVFGFMGIIVGAVATFMFGLLLIMAGLEDYPMFKSHVQMYWTFGIFMASGAFLFGRSGYYEVDRAKEKLHEASTFHCNKCHGENTRFSGWMQWNKKFQMFEYKMMDTLEDVTVICDDCEEEIKGYAKPVYEYPETG